MLMAALSPSALRALAVPFGLLWGSFLNVVIYRLPREMSVIRPGSQCPSCGKPIAFYDNVPVVSFLLLRGKTRCCKTQMSWRYPIVELLGGLASWAVMDLVLSHTMASDPIVRPLALYLAYFALTMGLIAAAFIDWEHMYLPDAITLGGAALGVVTAPLREVPIVSTLLGAGASFLIVWLPFIVVYRRIRGHAGMGLGDAKLLMLAGAWFGIIGAVFVLLAGALQGVVGAAVLYLLKRKIELPESVIKDREELQKAADAGDLEAKKLIEEDPLAAVEEDGTSPTRMPFGPFLIMSIVELIFFRQAIDDAILHTFTL